MEDSWDYYETILMMTFYEPVGILLITPCVLLKLSSAQLSSLFLPLLSLLEGEQTASIRRYLLEQAKWQSFDHI